MTSRSSGPLTEERLCEALRVFAALTVERGPTLREFQHELNLSSTSVTAYRIALLRKRGLIEQVVAENRSRRYRVTARGRALLAEQEPA